MNNTVTEFHHHHEIEKYEREHSPRLDFTIQHFSLDQMKNQTVADFGCGAGPFLKRLDNSNKKYGFDGAFLNESNKLCDFIYYRKDLDLNWSEQKDMLNDDYKTHTMYGVSVDRENMFDVSFCFETLEHLASPYNALCNIKWMTKKHASIYLSIPDVLVTHNTIYPGLMYPHTNFEQFLEQMALPIEEAVFFNKPGHWQVRLYKCKNAPWQEKILKFHKHEEKFVNASPLEAANL